MTRDGFLRSVLTSNPSTGSETDYPETKKKNHFVCLKDSKRRELNRKF